jgi:hypothetical protein
MESRKVSTSSGCTNPGSTRRSAWKLRTISPAPTSSTRASAIWATTRKLRARCRNGEREQEDRRIDADLAQARKALGPDRDEKAKAGRRKPEADDASEDPEGHALEKDFAGELFAVGAEGGSERELLLPAIGPHEEQVGDVRTGDEEHHSDRAEEDPEHVPHVAHHVLLQRHDVRVEARLLQHLEREALRILLDRERDHPRNVGVRGVDADPRLEAADSLIAEIADEHFRGIELEGEVEVGLEPEEAKFLGQHTHDLAGLSVHVEGPPENVPVRAEPAPPVGLTEEERQRRAGGIVLLAEDSAEERPRAQQGERAVGDHHGLGALRLREPGHRDLFVVPHADFLENLSLGAVREVKAGRLVHHVEAEAGRGMPDPDERLGVLEG